MTILPNYPVQKFFKEEIQFMEIEEVNQEQQESKQKQLLREMVKRSIEKFRKRNTENQQTERLKEQDKKHILLDHIDKAKYFVMRAASQKSLQLSVKLKEWAVPERVFKTLKEAYEENENILLLFTVKGSNVFQGIG